MPSYLVETYMPRTRAADARATGLRARSAAAAMALEGTAVRYIRTAFVPGDETCFHFLEAASDDVVEEACKRAGISSPRIVPVVE